MLSFQSRSARSAFTLIETLIASAIIALTATGIYYAFLRMNDFAVASRADTSAKIILERAVNLATTSEWRSSVPPILSLTQVPPATPVFKTFNPDTGADSDGSVSLFTDPQNNTVVTGTIYRQVVPYTDPNAKDLGDVYQLTFKLEYKLHKRADEPLTTVYAYYVRACDK